MSNIVVTNRYERRVAEKVKEGWHRKVSQEVPWQDVTGIFTERSHKSVMEKAV